jgi:SagB-type dehydrogenase family enzyme
MVVVAEGIRNEPRASSQIVREYHARTKHRRTAYAAGPETLDWEAQPAPFRTYAGAPVVALPREGDTALSRWLERPLASLHETHEPSAPSLHALGALLHLSFGITAWKTFGPDRWAVRANPSSGNLHPVEAYLVVRSFPGLVAGIYHYRPEDHVLERRAELALDRDAKGPHPSLAIGLSTVMWRETWKYGERAFRYCQLDTGHAVAALHYAASLLGWRTCEQTGIGTDCLAHALGLDRLEDYPARRHPDTEREEAELLVSLSCVASEPPDIDAESLRHAAASSTWSGIASTIDAHPMYRWPVVNDISRATRIGNVTSPARPAVFNIPPHRGSAAHSAADLIRGRRSAQRFDSRFWLGREGFFSLLESVGPSRGIDLVLFVHRVHGIDSGVYLLTRSPERSRLAARLASSFTLSPVADAPGPLGLRRIALVEPRALARLAREVHCHQDIAAQACFAAGMVAEFDAVIEQEPAAYRWLHRQAGMLGHVLYLEAEARGLRGTGIGCFLDDVFHDLLELRDTEFQTLYHFAVGKAVGDARIETVPTRCPGYTARTESEDFK